MMNYLSLGLTVRETAVRTRPEGVSDLRADAAPLNELWIPNRLVALEVETVIDKTYLTELPERVPEGKRAGAQSDIS